MKMSLLLVHLHVYQKSLSNIQQKSQVVNSWLISSLLLLYRKIDFGHFSPIILCPSFRLYFHIFKFCSARIGHLFRTIFQYPALSPKFFANFYGSYLRFPTLSPNFTLSFYGPFSCLQTLGRNSLPFSTYHFCSFQLLGRKERKRVAYTSFAPKLYYAAIIFLSERCILSGAFFMI